MPNISDRPYTGTWQNNMRQVVRHTPDGMVFINGDLALPGCERCRGRIDIQRFVTAISVDASTEPGGLSATVALSIPRISGDQIFRDGYNKLYPGLEVHIYMRGYFPTSGYFGAAGPAADIQLREEGGANIEWANVPAYPYYPVFHGVVTNVTHDYSGGEYHANVSCASLLHFWQHQKINSEGAHLANRGDNSQVRAGMTGTNYSNTHPFGMIYDLYRSGAGAAAGVTYFAESVSNLDAPMDGIRAKSGTNTWSHAREYWDQRFRNRIQNLRMYGVNGNLFNAAQQAFLGQRGISDFQNLLKHVQFAEDGTLSNIKDPFSQDIAVAKALGFERSGFDFIWGAIDNPDDAANSQVEGDLREAAVGDKSPASLNMIDMIAYTRNISDFGQMQKYESTYETKLQIVDAVREVTGYEFYQDVDGDLVFKPPFYNLDTSSNRVYRIEDIDIISINFTHAEPTATWIIVKPTYFKSLGAGLNSEQMNRGAVYADWKLVAQFGWRDAQTVEITYTTDVRACFAIGVARLDLLNIGVNSASVTIPLRPEMRPGIPVYIPFDDSFYYITQMSHGLSYGAQCTTSLQLTCRRRKFFAPGLPDTPADGQPITDLIRLDRVDLPPRPIQVHEDGGIPRLAGFPNVVMALDPTRVNPKFLPVGAGLPHLQSTEDVELYFNFIREDLKGDGIFQELPASQAQDPTEAPAQSTQYRMQVSEDVFLVFSIMDLAAAYNDLQNARDEVDRATDAIAAKRTKLRIADQTATSFQTRGPSTTINAKLAKLQQTLDLKKAAQLQTEQTLRQGIVVDSEGIIQEEGVPDSNLFRTVIEATRLARGGSVRRTVDGIPGSDELASQLDLLENLKVSYSANSLPGHYRYYSASHPDPNMQGQKAVFMHDRKRRKAKPKTTGTGGGATPAPVPPAQVPVDTSPVDVDGLTPEQAFRKRLKAAGISIMSYTNILAYRTAGGMRIHKNKTIQVQDPDDPKKKIEVPNPYFGILGPDPGNPATPEQIRAAPLTEEKQDNILNVLTAAEILKSNLAQNPQWQAAVAEGNARFRGSSLWRPFDVTESGGVSQHAKGIAIDIVFSTKPSRGPAFDNAIRAVFDEGQKMWNQGLIGGLGLYPNTATPFIHIDVRSRSNKWVLWKGKSLKCSTSGAGDGVTVTGGGSQANKDGCAWWQEHLLRPTSGVYPGATRPNNRNTPFPDGSAPPPDVGQPPPPVPVEPPPPPPPEPPEVIDGPPITLIEIDLKTPVQVRGFVPPTVEDPLQRPPEADWGLVTATKGMIIARGPSLTPVVVSTDKIQTVRWSQFRMTKDTSISGDTPNGGEYSFRRKDFKKRLSERFFNAAQDTDPTAASTPLDMFKELWDLIAADLAEIGIPEFDPNDPQTDPDLFIVEDANITPVPFLDAVYSAYTATSAGALTAELSARAAVEAVTEAEASSTVPVGFFDDGQEAVDASLAALAAQEARLQDESFGIPGPTILSGEIDPLFLRSQVTVDRFGQPVEAKDVLPTRVRPPTLTVNVRVVSFTLKELKSFPQFSSTGPTKRGGKGQAFNSTLRKLSDAYAEVLAAQFSSQFDAFQLLAMEPSTGREDRLSLLTAAFDSASIAALNDDTFKSTEKGRRTIKVEKFAKTGSPIHSPVRPVSDARGYEVFGSYRYGRGLTIEPGGSFAWLHNSEDPFGRLSFQAADELVTALTQVKGGKGSATSEFQKAAQARLVIQIDLIREEEDFLQSELAIAALPPEAQAEAEARLNAETQSRAELRVALGKMMSSQTGQDAVNELLTSNPAPDGSVEVLDLENGVNATQLERKFANFSASYTKSGPFKQSVTNAAYRLVDLTNHLQHPDLQACSCKGSASDVALAAFGRLQFAAVQGIDGERSPAEAFVAEQIINESVDYFYQQKALRGEVLNPNQTPDAGLFDKLKSQIGTSLSGVRNGFVSTGNQFSEVPEQFRNLSDDFREAFGG